MSPTPTGDDVFRAPPVHEIPDTDAAEQQCQEDVGGFHTVKSSGKFGRIE